jgi:Ca-activated chloride channel homolog
MKSLVKSYCVLLVALVLPSIPNIVYAQASAVDNDIAKGNDYYKNQQYQQAEEQYKKALATEPNSQTGRLNLAAALVRQNKKEEAMGVYDALIKTATENNVLATAWYNKGVILSGEDKLEESIEAYKNALRKNPDDTQTRENLQKALLELKKQQQLSSKNKKPTPQQPKPSSSKLKKREADQRLKLLQQKEKQVQDKVQKEKTKGGGSQSKDW